MFLTTVAWEKILRLSPFFSLTPLIKFHLKISCPWANEDRHFMAVIFIVVGRFLGPCMQYHRLFLLPGLYVQLGRKTSHKKQLKSLHPSWYNRVLSALQGHGLRQLWKTGLNGMSDFAVHIDTNTCSSLGIAHTCFYYSPEAVTSSCLLGMTELFLTNDYEYEFSVENKTKQKNRIWDLTKQ